MTIGKKLLLAILFVATVVLAAGPPLSAYEVQADLGIIYAQPNEAPLKADIYRPIDAPGAVPVILALHGGAWVSGCRSDLREIANLLASHGYAVVSADYRLAPIYTYPAQLEDVRAAARWIYDNAAQYGFNRNCLIVYGESAGAQIASLYAVLGSPGYPRPIAAVDIFGPTDFTAAEAGSQAEEIIRIYLGVSRDIYPELYSEASPISHVNKDNPPFFIVHGTADLLVPYSQSTAFADALKSAGIPVTLYTMEGTGHNVPAADSEDGSKLRTALLSFLDSQVAANCRSGVQTGSPGG